MTPTATATASATYTATLTPTATPTSTGTPTATTPPTSTSTATPTPTPTVTTVRVQSESANALSSGVVRADTYDAQGGGRELRDFNSGRWARFNNVDLRGGLAAFRLRGDTPNVGTVTLRAGSATGTVLCTLSWSGSSAYATQAATCTPSLTGVQTLFLVAGSIAWINHNWFELDLLPAGSATAIPTPTATAAAATATPTATPTVPAATATPTPSATATATRTATPGGTTSVLRIEAESYTSAAVGVYFGFTDDVGGGQAVYNFDTPRWVGFSNVDLLGGVVRFRVRGDSAGSGNISLRTGSATGPVLCTLAWTPGGTYYTTRETTCTPSATGVQSLFLTNDSVPWVNTNWIEIERQP
ncbi:MAG: carbohydrate-binding protein [Chloroflexota bacterium]|nr:carbohydrate-binding protein [Chloroflexota bacterium]